METKDKIIKHNDIAWGEDPELFGPKDWYRNSRIIQEITTRIRSGKILDFGCGSGIMLARLAQTGAYTLVGIDISPANIRYIKRKYDNYPNMTAQVGSFTSLSEFSNLAAIICGETLEHMQNDVAVVKHFARALAPGGYVVVSVPAHQSRWTDIDVYAGHYRRYSKEQLAQLFLDQGFTIERCYYWGFPLGWLWDRWISYPVLRRKMSEAVVYTESCSLMGSLLAFTWLKQIASYFFSFDRLFFPDNPLGNGVILVARKPHATSTQRAVKKSKRPRYKNNSAGSAN